MATKSKKATKAIKEKVKKETKKSFKTIKKQTGSSLEAAAGVQTLEEAKQKILARKAHLAAQSKINEQKKQLESLGGPEFDEGFLEEFSAQPEEFANDLYAPGTDTNGIAPNDIPNSLFSSNPLAGTEQQLRWKNGEDMFKTTEEYALKHGDMVKYRVYINNELRATEYPPCSWEKIQEKYGSGQYRIQAYSANTGRIFKTESQLIGADPNKVADKTQPLKENTPFNDPFTMMTWMQQQRESESAKIRQEANIQIAQNKQFNEVILGIIQAQSAGKGDTATALQTMMLDMQKSQFEMLNKMQDNFTRVVEAINSKIDSKKDSMSPMELLTLMESRENKGWEKAQKMMELIESKVADAREDSDEGGEKDSVTDTLIKSLAPVIASAMSGPQNQPLPQQFVQQGPPPQRMMPPPQQSTPGHGPSGQTLRPVGPAQRPQPPTQPLGQSPLGQSPLGQSPLGQAAMPQKPPQTAQKPVIPVQKPVVVHSQTIETVKSVPQAQNGLDHAQQPIQTMKGNQMGTLDPMEIKIRDLALPIITDKLTKQADPKTSGHDVITELQKHGIKAQDLIKYWSLEKLIATARQIGVPKFVDPWFKEFFGEIKSIAGTGGSGPINQPSIN